MNKIALRFLFVVFAWPVSAVTAEVLTLSTSNMVSGQCIQAEWNTGVRERTFPIMVCKRTQQQLDALSQTQSTIDPKLYSAILNQANRWGDSTIPSQMLAMHHELDAKASRSIRDDYFVALKTEPFIGCELKFDRYTSHAAFSNPCHGNLFDSNGRPVIDEDFTIYPQLFLQIPPHYWKNNDLIIGEIEPGKTWHLYDFRSIDTLGTPPISKLINAAVWGDINALEKILKDKKDPVDINASSAPSLPMNTALTQAVSCRQYEAVQWLLEHGADPNPSTQYADSLSLLGIAEIIGHQGIIKLLKEHGAKK